ncbi:uncharacterized protein [Onthophagus taurus]|uniref:uncharacterized protein n=1 Tax=Onthophagus taurus TaxID=166361 RepID=UPI0039BDCF53
MENPTRKPIQEAPASKKTGNLTNSEKEVTPRFLVVKALNGLSFDKLSPFILQKQLYGLYGDFKSIKKTREGLLLETASAAQAKRVMASVRIGDIDVEVNPHRALNTSKGIVYCPDLLNCSVEEIQMELRSQGVIEVRRIKSKREGVLSDTPNHILTFNSPILPKKVKAAYYSLDVRLYIPAPMRCFKCQRYGHTSLRCEALQICVCGKAIHEGRPCEDPLVCVNCGGPHSARSRSCPVFKKEAAIQEIRTKDKLSYVEAKRKLQQTPVRTPTQGVSYSSATASMPKYDSLIKDLIPAIVAAIKPLIKSEVKAKVQPSTSTSGNLGVFKIPLPVDLTDNVETSSQFSHTESEKRKREGALSSSTDDLSETSTDNNRKKKKGWQKGRPRNVTTPPNATAGGGTQPPPRQPPGGSMAMKASPTPSRRSSVGGPPSASPAKES